jgi:predicted HTH transcriptional regulator
MNREDFANFCNNPNKVSLRELLKNHTGEYNEIDFKEDFIEISKLAKHIIAMANKEGGVIIFGIKDNYEIVGIKLDLNNDKTKIRQGLEEYLPVELKYKILDFSYTESEYPKLKDKDFRVIIVTYTPKDIPFLAKKDGKEIDRNKIYIRKNASSEIVSYEDIKDILKRNIEAKFTSRELSLSKHLDELQELYSKLPFDNNIYNMMKQSKLPKVEFYDFIKQKIKEKKDIIEQIIKDNNIKL